MKILVLSIFALALVLPAEAGVLQFGYKHAVKPAAKVVSYPVRHPKKSAQAAGHSLKRVVF